MSTTPPAAGTEPSAANRGAFSGRMAFIMAAIGSAVGLGNIWRFPYVAYSNGGGAFMLPYVIALLCAGIPLLFLDYAIGHRWRGSSPLSLRRLHRLTEPIGWWHVLISCVIAVYYAVVLAWAIRYFFYSFSKAWGDDPGTFFMTTFVQSIPAEQAHVAFHFVPGIVVPLVAVWVACIGALALGVQKGIAGTSIVFIPLLVVMFLTLVVVSLTLPGAMNGLDALFTPDWSALTNSGVWVAAFGQIFFSLSVGFGIMVTYASYVKKNADMTGSGLVVGFANSSFELLCGIGVFAALGFMAQNAGKPVSEVASSGIGLAFIAFPTIINQAPMGTLIGVLFFGSLVFAGFTSMISIIEVIIAAFEDKFGTGRVASTMMVGIPLALISMLLFPTTTGLNLLDVTDAFVNNFGIVGASMVCALTLTAGFTALPTLRRHLNKSGSFKVGRGWQLLVGAVAPVILGYTLIGEIQTRLTEGYGGMPKTFVWIWGFGVTIGCIVLAFLLSMLPWSTRSNLGSLDSDGDPIPGPVLDPIVDRHRLDDMRAQQNIVTGSVADTHARTTIDLREVQR